MSFIQITLVPRAVGVCVYVLARKQAVALSNINHIWKQAVAKNAHSMQAQAKQGRVSIPGSITV
jgi:hypothetical protein